MADKTVRPTNINNTNDTHDATLRPQSINANDSFDPTLRPQSINANDSFDPTLRPQSPAGDNHDATVRPQTPMGDQSEKTLRAQKAEIARLNTTYETEYIIDGKKYKFIKPISEGTGEANLLLVEHQGTKYALKLYYVGIELPDTEILKAVKATNGQLGLVGLYSYGKWTNPNTGEQLSYELMQYCEGGSLANYPLNGDEAKLKQLAVMMAMCIHACHEKGFLHCDIKPANFLFVDKARTRLVLTDFGISIRYAANGRAKSTLEARTRIYAAPEFYYIVPGSNYRELSKSSDFFSLGMTLLCLWMGESAFMQQEGELMRLKIAGKLQYPPELSDQTIGLLRALTTVHEGSRPDFKQIKEWASGKNPFAQFQRQDNQPSSNFNVVFNAGKNQIAHSPAELAQFMMADITLAQKYLYSGKISQWLKENLRPELQVELEEIVETKYPADKKAGVFAACLVLDPTMPYYDINGKECSTQQEIASSIAHNKTAYQQALKNSGDLLYVMLRSQGEEQFVDRIYRKISNPNSKPVELREALYELIYTLDPAQPFIYEAEVNDNIQLIDCNTIKDVIDTAHRYVPSDDTWEDITRPFFVKWVGHRDRSVAARIQDTTRGFPASPGAYSWGVIYSLHRGINYNLAWDQNTLYTYQHIAMYINQMIDCQFNPSKYTDVERSRFNNLHKALKSIKGTRLYFYLKSKGSYDQWITWIENCMNWQTSDNKRKPAPHNEKVAIYKLIKGMGADPIYYTASGKTLTQPADVSKLSRSERQLETSDQKGLSEWLTVFFQEDPALDLSVQYTFERKTVQYIQLLASVNNSLAEVTRYNQAKAQINKALTVAKSRYVQMLVMQGLLALGCILPLTLIIIMMCVLGVPFNHLWAYIFSVVLVAIVGMLVKKCYFDISIKHSRFLELTDDSSFEDSEVMPLYHAYHPRGNFDSPIIDKANDYANDWALSRNALMQKGIPAIVGTIGCIVLLYFAVPYFGQRQADKGHIPYMVATWEGKFGSNKAAIEINVASPKKVEALIYVKFKNITSEKLYGSIDVDNRTMTLEDRTKNKILDGVFKCSFTDDTFSAMTGTYHNPKNGKNVNFRFSRKMSAEEIKLPKQTQQAKSNGQYWSDWYAQKKAQL